jgi:hypothetical protein
VANFVYSKAKEAFLNGDIDVLSDPIKVLIVDSIYAPDQASDDFVVDIPVSAIKYMTIALQNVSNILGVLDADNVPIVDYSGNPFNALVLFADKGTQASSRLIAYIDNSPGLPFAGSATQIPISIVWNDGAEKIISIT